MNKRDDFDDRSKNPREERHDRSEDSDNRKGNDDYSRTPGDGGQQQQQSEDIDETNRIERRKKD